MTDTPKEHICRKRIEPTGLELYEISLKQSRIVSTDVRTLAGIIPEEYLSTMLDSSRIVFPQEREIANKMLYLPLSEEEVGTFMM